MQVNNFLKLPQMSKFKVTHQSAVGAVVPHVQVALGLVTKFQNLFSSSQIIQTNTRMVVVTGKPWLILPSRTVLNLSVTISVALDFCGLYYKHITIINDNSRVDRMML